MKATEELQRAVKLDPDSYDVQYNLGVVLGHSGHLDEAIEELKAAQNLNPREPGAAYELSLLYRKKKDFQHGQQEVVAFHKAKDLTGRASNAAASGTRANELLLTGNTQEAIDEYERALNLAPDNAKLHYNLALALEKLDRRQQEEKELAKAIELDPNLAEAHNLLGVLFMRDQKLDDSEREFKIALEIKPAYAEAQSNLGTLYGQQGKTDLAATWFRHTIKNNPRYVEAYVNLGLVLAQQEHYADAEKVFQQALRLDRHNRQPLTALSMLSSVNRPVNASSRKEYGMASGSKQSVSRRNFLVRVVGGATSAIAARVKATQLPTDLPPRNVYLVPNFHPASCGWLANFSRERVYCANSYLDHLDRVCDDPNYKFVLSEVNNMIAIMNFAPERIEEIKRLAGQGRIELVNAFFLESTINLSGGEALIKQGVEGLRWHEKVMGFRPLFAWTIDVCGTHDQMGQICSGLELDAMVYTRMNHTGSTIHWAESPDGSRILALCPGHYSEFQPLFKTKDPLAPEELKKLESFVVEKNKTTPSGAPVLILGGSGDYNLAPIRKQYPSEFLQQWKQVNPQTTIHISTLSEYVDAILPGIKSGMINIPTMRGGTGYTFDSFWIENPKVKTWYRLNEHGLQAAETLATCKPGFEVFLSQPGTVRSLDPDASEHGSQYTLGLSRRNGL